MGWLARLANGFTQIGRANSAMPAPSQNYAMSPNAQPTRSVNLMATKTDIQMMSPGFSQPVWGPEISTVGAYSREGYTSITSKIPTISFRQQVKALTEDEDVSLAINHLSSMVTGAEHYWKGLNEVVAAHLQDFSDAIQFDIFDTELVKELLAFGNSFWMPLVPVHMIQSHDDLLHLPISSMVRIWWDRRRKPYKYEFRGGEWQGYHNPEDIIHFTWNKIDASPFGTGYLTSLLSPRSFDQITNQGIEPQELPSPLDRKMSTQHTMQQTEYRYISRNVYQALDADADERATLQSDVAALKPNEDIITGSKLEVTELGTSARNFNPTQYMDITMGAIMKALNDFRGKQGSEGSHQYANAKTAAMLDNIGLSSFPHAVLIQLIAKIFRPWYLGNPATSPDYAMGIAGIPWEDAELELNFGAQEKTDIPIEQKIKLLEVAISAGALPDIGELRDLLEDAGLGIRKDVTEQIVDQQQMGAMSTGVMPMSNQPMGNQPMQMTNTNFGSVNGGGPINNKAFHTNQADQNGRPADNNEYDNMNNPRFVPNPYDSQPSNVSQAWNIAHRDEYDPNIKELTELSLMKKRVQIKAYNDKMQTQAKIRETLEKIMDE